jgi:hypothetical protein
MNWYAIQLQTGKESEVAADLKDCGREVLQPQKPLIYKSGGKLKLVQKPLIPGYIFARLEITDFYIYKRDLRIEHMMIRLCGNGYEAVSITESELEFIRLCSLEMKPLLLDLINDKYFNIVNPPPWAEKARINWYAGDKFKANLSVNMKGHLETHSFTIAAFTSRYNGRYRMQLQDLLEDGFAERDEHTSRFSQRKVEAGTRSAGMAKLTHISIPIFSD